MSDNQTPPDRCPNCGQPKNDVGKYYGCGSTIRGDYRSASCRELVARNKAEILRLAMEAIRRNYVPGSMAGDIARQALADIIQPPAICPECGDLCPRDHDGVPRHDCPVKGDAGSETPREPTIVDQPPPAHNDGPAVWDLVMADMRERDATGRARYGTRLQPHNGRDAMVDAYQECLDLCVYLRQAIYERDGR